MKKLSMDQLNRVSVDEFKEQQKNQVVVVLDNIRSMHNVGSAFRTSDAFNIEKIILGGITAKPPHREIHKTALGATDSVAWEHETEIAKALSNLKSEGYTIIIIEQTDKSIALQDIAFASDKKYAFVFGNEAFGVSEEALPFGDKSVEIPQFGTKHSLNVSVSMGIVLWDYVKTTL